MTMYDGYFDKIAKNILKGISFTLWKGKALIDYENEITRVHREERRRV